MKELLYLVSCMQNRFWYNTQHIIGISCNILEISNKKKCRLDHVWPFVSWCPVMNAYDSSFFLEMHLHPFELNPNNNRWSNCFWKIRKSYKYDQAIDTGISQFNKMKIIATILILGTSSVSTLALSLGNYSHPNINVCPTNVDDIDRVSEFLKDSENYKFYHKYCHFAFSDISWFRTLLKILGLLQWNCNPNDMSL